MAAHRLLACWSACLLIPTYAQLLWHEQPLQQQIYSSPCELLAAIAPGQVVTPNDKAYWESQSAYWTAQQAELTPSCRFYPHNARDIQEALADIIIPNNVSIAIVSGGHSSNTGASNVNHGITIDLSRLNQVGLAEKDRSVTLGPGARWNDVYTALEPHNLTVSGGRAAYLGVGGYVLGGGLSWFANEHGWTCDSVLEFEVVTPQGQTLWASKHFNDDIFYALKGSLGAFGIVTKIKVPTIENKAVYGGAVAFEGGEEDIKKLFDALQLLHVNAQKQPAQSGYLSFAYLEAKKQWEYTAYLLNTKGDTDVAEAFTAIPHKASSLRRTTIGSAAAEISESNPLGQRRARFTLTFKSSTQTISALHDLIASFTSRLTFDPADVLAVTYQPLTTAHLQAQSNMFNLNPYQGPLLLIMVEIWWTDSSRDEYFEGSARHLRKAMEQKLSGLSSLHPFIYPNYAAKDQNPFLSLRASQKGMLKAIKRKHDPENLWQKLVPGIWHI